MDYTRKLVAVPKLHLDKYYTSDVIATHCINICNEKLAKVEITEVIEPSAGNGAFSKKLKGCIAYDIEPEDNSIIAQDFLKVALKYKKGRLFIGNPPFGTRNVLAVSFYKQCVKLGDYIAFILPISQYNNTQQMYEFNLLYSEDLGKQKFTDRNIHCCFNVYIRPPNNLNQKPRSLIIPGVKIIESRLGNNRPVNYDYAICGWGAVGKELLDKHYAKEFYFIIDTTRKPEILKLLQNVDWLYEYKMTSTPNLLQWQIIQYLQRKLAASL